MKLPRAYAAVAALVLATLFQSEGRIAFAQSPNAGFQINLEVIKVQQTVNVRINLVWNGSTTSGQTLVRIHAEYPGQYYHRSGLWASGTGTWKHRIISGGIWQLDYTLPKSRGNLASGQTVSWFQFVGSIQNNPTAPVLFCATVQRAEVDGAPVSSSSKVCIDVSK